MTDADREPCSVCRSKWHKAEDHDWFSDEYLEASDEFQRASLQASRWREVRKMSAFAEDQYQLWSEIAERNRWTEPGG